MARSSSQWHKQSDAHSILLSFAAPCLYCILTHPCFSRLPSSAVAAAAALTRTSTDCKFLALKVQAQGKYSSYSLAIKSAPDTCTLVVDLNAVSFAENILGLVVHDDDSATHTSKIETDVPYYKTGAASTVAMGVVVPLVMAAGVIMTTLQRRML